MSIHDRRESDLNFVSSEESFQTFLGRYGERQLVASKDKNQRFATKFTEKARKYSQLEDEDIDQVLRAMCGVYIAASIGVDGSSIEGAVCPPNA